MKQSRKWYICLEEKLKYLMGEKEMERIVYKEEIMGWAGPTRSKCIYTREATPTEVKADENHSMWPW